MFLESAKQMEKERKKPVAEDIGERKHPKEVAQSPLNKWWNRSFSL